MDWVETPESSNISRIRFEEQTSSLLVEFKSGAIYEYFDVPLTTYEGMVAAGSKGQFLAQVIKGVYRYARR